MRHIAIVPARKGSKGLPDKNLQKLGGLSLIDLAVQSCEVATFFDKIVVTTDYDNLSGLSQLSEKIVVKQRSAQLCGDDTEMSDVVWDCIPELGNGDCYVWLIQVTSPLRSSQDFQRVKLILEGTRYNSLISVCHVGGNHPCRMYTIKNDRLYPLSKGNFSNRQKLTPIFKRNGCFYVFKKSMFMATKNFYHKPCYPYLMSEEASIAIDSAWDLKLARAVYDEANATKLCV